MSNSFSTFIKKKVVRKNQNLVSLDGAFQTLERVLRGHQVGSIFDAGASNGSLSRQLMGYFPGAAVYGFEPNPEYRQVLDKLSQSQAKFRPQYLALGNQEGSVTLNIAASPGNTSLFSPGPRLKNYDKVGSEILSRKEVELVTIDSWAQKSGVSAIELMKFDIQGGELEAMKGASHMLNSSTLAVYTEVLFNALYEGGAIFSDVDKFLRSCGFVLYDFYKPKYDARGLLLWGNATFVHAERLGI